MQKLGYYIQTAESGIGMMMGKDGLENGNDNYFNFNMT